MERARHLQIQQLGSELCCQLCDGYFVDAFTVVECLHSFCKSCIMKHVKRSGECPRCGTQLNKARLTAAIRPDQTLQSVVYKLVPRLFNDEMQRRRDFYKNQEHSQRDRSLSPERRGDVSSQQFVHTLADPISFSLEFSRSGAEDDQKTDLPAVRFFQAPAGLSVSHLKKLLHLKHGLGQRDLKVDILYDGDVLPKDVSVMDVACQYNWDRTAPMAFFYRWTRKRSASTAAPPPKRPKTVTAPEDGVVAADTATVEHREKIVAIQYGRKEAQTEVGPASGAPLPEAATTQGTAPAGGPRAVSASAETLLAAHSVVRPPLALQTTDPVDAESAQTSREGSDRASPPRGVTGRPGGAGTGRRVDSGGTGSHSSGLLTNGVASGSSGASASKTSVPLLGGGAGERRSNCAESNGTGATSTVNAASGVVACEAVAVKANGAAQSGTTTNTSASHDVQTSVDGEQTNAQTPITAVKAITTQATYTCTKTSLVDSGLGKRGEKYSTKANGNSVRKGPRVTDGTNGHNTKRRAKKASSSTDRVLDGGIRSEERSITSKAKSLDGNGVEHSPKLPSSPADVTPEYTEVPASSLKGGVGSGKALNPYARKCALEPGEILKSSEHPPSTSVSTNGVLQKGLTSPSKGIVSNISSPAGLSTSIFTASTERTLMSLPQLRRELLSKASTASLCPKNGKENPPIIPTYNASRMPTKDKDGGSKLSIDVYDFDEEAEKETAVRLKVTMPPTKEVNDGDSKRVKLQQLRESDDHSTKDSHATKRNGHVRAQFEKRSAASLSAVSPVYMTVADVQREHPSTPAASLQRPPPLSTPTVPPHRPAPQGAPTVSVQHPPPPSFPGVSLAPRPTVGPGVSLTPRPALGPRESLAPPPAVGTGASLSPYPAAGPGVSLAPRPAVGPSVSLAPRSAVGPGVSLAPSPAMVPAPSAVPPSPRRSLAALPDLRPIGAGAIPLMTGQLERFLHMVSRSAVSQPNGSWRLPANAASSLLTRAAAPTQLAPGKPIQPKPVQGRPPGQTKPAVQMKSSVQRKYDVQTKTTVSTKSSVQTKNVVQPGSPIQGKMMTNGRNIPPQPVSSKQNGSIAISRPSSSFPSEGMVSGEVSITRIPRVASAFPGGRPAPPPPPAELSRSPGSSVPAGCVTADGSVTIEKIRTAQPPPPPSSQSARPPNSHKLLAIAENLAMRKIQSQQRQAVAGGTASRSPASPAAAAGTPSAISSLISLSQTQQFHKQQQGAPEAGAPRGRPVASGSAARRQIPNPALLHHQSQGRLTVLNVPAVEAAGSGGVTATATGTTSASLARMERLTNSLGR